MSRRAADPMHYVRRMCDDFAKNTTRTPRSIRYYREELQAVVRTLQRLELNAFPQDITAADVRALMDDMNDRELTVSTRRGYICALRVWTEYYGNNVIADMHIRWPVDMRPNVRWLSQDQARKLLNTPKSAAQDLVVHCELCLGMRRVEVMRLTPSSFTGAYVMILGKGPMGGKPRTMPYHSDTDRVFRRWMAERNQMIADARRIRPTVDVPDDLLIWRQGGKLRTFAAKGSGIDKMLVRLEDEVGFKFSNHDLRRTFGRTMYHSGVRVAIIAKMLGHESEEQTLRYIGVDLDDMTDAMKQFIL